MLTLAQIYDAPPPPVCDILEACAGGAQAEATGQLLALQGGGPAAFRTALCGGVLPRLLLAQHQRPCAAAAMMQSLAAAISRVEAVEKADDPGCSLIEDTIQWLLHAQGGAGHDASDTGARWRSCVLLIGLLRALQSKLRQKGSLDLQDVERLQEIGEVLLARVQDRSADVRFVAVEGFFAMALDAAGAADAVSNRAMSDCNSFVRATAVRALVAYVDDVPAEIVARVAMDSAPPVRRALLDGVAAKLREKARSWAAAWPRLVLHSLGDRSRSVRASAAQCLLATLEGDWQAQILAQPELLEGTIGHVAAALAGLARQHPELANLSQQLVPEDALSAASGGCGGGLRARLAVTAAAALGDAPNAGAIISLVQDALKQQNSFEIRQLLLATLAAELPPDSSTRADLAKVAVAVLRFGPVGDTAASLLGKGILPAAYLGAGAAAPPSAAHLAAWLLRRTADSLGVGDAGRAGGGAAAAEVHFSRLAACAVEGPRRALEAAEREVEVLTSNVAAAKGELSEHQWALASRRALGGVRAAAVEEEEECGGMEQRVASAEAALTAAEKRRGEQQLRAALAAGAWLQHSRAPLAKDGAQRGLLDTVLLPAVRSSWASPAAQVAAAHGIAVFASRSESAASSHWPFFSGLLESQLPRLREPWSAAAADGAPLCMAARLAEVALLFLCDAVLLHGGSLGEARSADAFAALARAFLALGAACPELRSGQELQHLRAVACDRACSLIVMGHTSKGGAAAKWVLGRLLADVCDPGSLVAGGASGACLASGDLASGFSNPRVGSAITSGRVLRFFATLPQLSPVHAELLAVAAEAFFGSRLWMASPRPQGSSTRATPAVRAARLACGRAGMVPSAAGAEGLSSAGALQLRIVRSIAAALLASPKEHAPLLSDALAAGVLAAASGGPPLAWAGGEAPKLREALGDLLCHWVPSTSAKAVGVLMEEIRHRRPTTGTGFAWAQAAFDAAADLRHDLAAIGICGPGLGAGLSAWAMGGPAVASLAMQTPERPPAVEVTWQLVNDSTGDEIALQRGGELVLGRRLGCDVVVQGAAVGGEHCVVCWGRAGGVELQDLESTNGTYLNGARLGRGDCAELRDGDVFALAARLGPRFTLQACTVTRSEAGIATPDPVTAAAIAAYRGGGPRRGKRPAAGGREKQMEATAPLAKKPRAAAAAAEDPATAAPRDEGHGGLGDASIQGQTSLHPADATPRSAKPTAPVETEAEIPEVAAGEEDPAVKAVQALREALACATSEATGQGQTLPRPAGAAQGAKRAAAGAAQAIEPPVPVAEEPERATARQPPPPPLLEASAAQGGAAERGQAAAPPAGKALQGAERGAVAATQAERPRAAAAAEDPPRAAAQPPREEAKKPRVAAAEDSTGTAAQQPRIDACSDQGAATEGQVQAPPAGNDRQGTKRAAPEAAQAFACVKPKRRLIGKGPGLPKAAEAAAPAAPAVAASDAVAAGGAAAAKDDCRDAADDAAGGIQGAAAAAVPSDTQLENVALSVIAAVHSEAGTEPRLVDLTSGAVHRLPAQGIVAIGRRQDCEVVVPGPAVSSRHCVLTCSDGAVELEDVSTNGTFVNDTAVPKGFSLPQRVALHDGDTLALGHRRGPALMFLIASD